MIFEGQFIMKVNSKIYHVIKFLQSNIGPVMIHYGIGSRLRAFHMRPLTFINI